MKFLCLLSSILFISSLTLNGQIAPEETYLQDIKCEMGKKWPENRIINVVFHGHSVPAGYFNTPNVKTFEAYPMLTLEALKKNYSTAVINVINTSIGGENSEQGSSRFHKEVLNHNPDVIFIDYALNDRSIGLDKAKKSWENMIEQALKKNIKVILMTPTPDLTENITDSNAILAKHAAQIKELSKKYGIGLIDVYSIFREKKIQGEDLSLYMSQSNHPNHKGHEIVKDLIIRYFFDKKDLNHYQSEQIKKIMSDVADWQLLHFEAQVLKGSQWPNSHAYWAWTNATMYLGMLEWARLSDKKIYWDFLLNAGEKSNWETGPNIYFADDICIVQVYLQLFEKYGDEKMIDPSKKALNKIIENAKNVSLDYYSKDSHSRWCWCDALFMAPPAFVRMGKLTGDKRFFDFVDNEFQVSYDTLFCKEENLFYRDTRYKSMVEENGEKVFWGRGNGWVIAGLTIIIDNLPDNHPTKNKYIALYEKMILRIAGLQDSRGFWHPSLLDNNAYPMPETSASGFFTYGVLWGINNGILDEGKYGPIAEKGWKALCSAVQDDGKLGYVQAIGADPKKVGPDDTEVYGIGAFLMAGTQMYKWITGKIK